jgi:4-hydroxybenzoate polyprenyltransferase/phosphoserine phosphatase
MNGGIDGFAANTECKSEMSDGVLTGPEREIFCVDLDGSLLATDLFWEHVFQLIKRRPWQALLVPWWSLRGRASLKARIAERIMLDAPGLPYNRELLAVIHAKRAEGVRVVLATASAGPWARGVASHLGVFDDVLSTTTDSNLKGRSKLAAIRGYCRAQGVDRFSYAGDSGADLPIWREAEAIYVVTPSSGLSRRLRAMERPVIEIGPRRKPLVAMAKALRPSQWIKNLLVFVPLLTSMQILDPSRVALGIAAFVSFCCCASSIYIINDLVDVAADRLHDEKRRRPFASGSLPLGWGPPMSAALLAAGLLLAWVTLPPIFLVVLAIYAAATLAYSFYIKSRLMADVLLLAILYAMRVFAGNAATSIPISEWLLGFSLFFFLSLAFVKRYVELDQFESFDPKRTLKGRGYRPVDLGLVETLGVCSGYLSLVILALYIKSDEVQLVYHRPDVLWGVCLILIYWISRLWFLAKRKELSGDPVVFAVRDRHSVVLGFLTVVIVVTGALLPAGNSGASGAAAGHPFRSNRVDSLIDRSRPSALVPGHAARTAR